MYSLSFLLPSEVENAIRFNSDISAWSVDKVTDMSYMFRGASAFNVDISSWQVSSLNDMTDMFNGATSFNHSLCEWGLFLDSSTLVEDAFQSTACDEVGDPSFTTTPPGPFCFSCN